MRVLGIDPGIANCGVAVLVDGRIHSLAVYRTKAAKPLATRVMDMALAIAPHFLDADRVVIECPNFPPGRKAAAQVWASFAMAAGMARFAPGGPIASYSSQRWRKMLGLPAIRGTTEAARRERKRTTRALMDRHHGADEIAGRLRGFRPAGLHEHAIDALAIATAYVWFG